MRGLIIFIFGIFLNFPIWLQAEEKLDFKTFIAQIPEGAGIPSLFKKNSLGAAKDSADLQSLLKKTSPMMEDLEKEFLKSRSFVRGAVEQPLVLNGLLEILQLSILRMRVEAENARWENVRRSMEAWFLFAADFSYEESSLVGIRLVGVVRSMLLDELEAFQTKYTQQLAGFPSMRQWFSRVRVPWPIDRVIVSEAKRVLKPPFQDLASSLAKSYQKNPYQTTAQGLKKIKGGQSEGAQVLAEFWRESDIDAMKTEMNRVSKLKVKLAMAEFELKNKKAPAQISELVKAGLLDQVPTDYFSGKPLDLTSL